MLGRSPVSHVRQASTATSRAHLRAPHVHQALVNQIKANLRAKLVLWDYQAEMLDRSRALSVRQASTVTPKVPLHVNRVLQGSFSQSLENQTAILCRAEPS